MKRVICHADQDSFYASIEVLHRPLLRGKPVAVAGDQEARHGIILAKTYEAKRYGIKTAMTIGDAKRLCPDLIVLPPNYPLYMRFSRMFQELLAEYSDFTEAYGPDEGWCDLTVLSDGKLHIGAEIAQEMRQQVRREMGITASIGVSWTKTYAKLGSDINKPDGFALITPENYKRVVWSLPVDDLLGVGRATAPKLKNLGIKTIGDIANTPLELLEGWFDKWGLYLHTFANGQDQSAVAEFGKVVDQKSVSHSWTMPRDAKDEQDCRIAFRGLSEAVAEKLRDMGMRGRTVQVWFRDNKLNSFGRQLTLPQPTCLSSELTDAAIKLLRANYNWERPLRSVGICAMNLVPASEEVQLSFFEDEIQRQRREAIEYALDGIRRRFGHQAIDFALMGLDDQLGKLDAKADHVIHPVGYF